jgi:hypothetical protein
LFMALGFLASKSLIRFDLCDRWISTEEFGLVIITRGHPVFVVSYSQSALQLVSLRNPK